MLRTRESKKKRSRCPEEKAEAKSPLVLEYYHISEDFRGPQNAVDSHVLHGNSIPCCAKIETRGNPREILSKTLTMLQYLLNFKRTLLFKFSIVMEQINGMFLLINNIKMIGMLLTF